MLIYNEGLCDKCQDCIPSNTSYQCVDKQNPCPLNCTRCIRATGLCQALHCGTCAACNNATNACEVTPTLPCGTNTECQFCDESGFCVSQQNRSCTLPDDDACRNPYCDANGQCVMSTDFSAVGTPCGTQTDCMKHSCDGTGKCTATPQPRNTSCTLPDGAKECQSAACDGSGVCVAIPLTNIPCKLDQATQSNRTLALCHSASCQHGICTTIQLTDGFNCTHRRNESNLDEKICEFSICSKGACTGNGTVPACIKQKHKTKIGIIIGVIGGAALLLAAAIIGNLFAVNCVIHLLMTIQVGSLV